MKTLVTVPELGKHLGDPAWRIFDCRFSLADPAAGRRAYLDSHIPGAFHADTNRHLSAAHIPGVTGRHPLPRRDDWIRRVRDWGISPEAQVVLYDDSGGMSMANTRLRRCA